MLNPVWHSGIAAQHVSSWDLPSVPSFYNLGQFSVKDDWELCSCTGYRGWFKGGWKRPQVWIWLYSLCQAQTSCFGYCTGCCSSECIDFVLCNLNLAITFPISDVSALLWKIGNAEALQVLWSHPTQVVGRNTSCIKLIMPDLYRFHQPLGILSPFRLEAAVWGFTEQADTW